MKQIKLKQLQGDNGLVVNYRSVLMDVIKRHPQGITLDEMGKALRVWNALNNSDNNILKLEDADWETLIGYLKAYPFGVVDNTLLELWHDVESAEEIKL